MNFFYYLYKIQTYKIKLKLFHCGFVQSFSHLWKAQIAIHLQIIFTIYLFFLSL